MCVCVCIEKYFNDIQLYINLCIYVCLCMLTPPFSVQYQTAAHCVYVYVTVHPMFNSGSVISFLLNLVY